MARPLLVPTAFATVLFATPALAAEDLEPPPVEIVVAEALPVVAAPILATLAPTLPADRVEALIPVATRAAGNARLPLYDDGAAMTKGCGNCR